MLEDSSFLQQTYNAVAAAWSIAAASAAAVAIAAIAAAAAGAAAIGAVVAGRTMASIVSPVLLSEATHKGTFLSHSDSADPVVSAFISLIGLEKD